ncbi:MAG: hypothetical protein IPO21_07030 [Bacteroidales bacterium]|nr:hypothetical protein [Bacteroidales bacterium]
MRTKNFFKNELFKVKIESQVRNCNRVGVIDENSKLVIIPNIIFEGDYNSMSQKFNLFENISLDTNRVLIYLLKGDTIVRIINRFSNISYRSTVDRFFREKADGSLNKELKFLTEKSSNFATFMLDDDNFFTPDKFVIFINDEVNFINTSLQFFSNFNELIKHKYGS